jgi:hypothetical protein
MTPSRAQYRMLHVLARGRLSFVKWPTRRIEVVDHTAKVDETWRFHEVTARIVVREGWAELTRFDPRHGEYGITIDGLALTQDLCDCKWVTRGGRWKDHHQSESREKLGGKLLCARCGRWVRCVSKKTPPHGAVRWNPRWGPVCGAHP